MDAILYLQKTKEVYTENMQDNLLSNIEVYDEEIL